MKRDMDLIRDILLKIEEEYVSTDLCNIEIPNKSKEEVAYHCSLCNEAGLVSDYEVQYGDGEILFFSVGGLTWDGFDYLEEIRNNSNWAKIKDLIKVKGLPVTIDVIKEIANKLIKAAIASLF